MYQRIIIATGMPRSGTSWLGEIVNSSPAVRLRVSPPFAYEFKNIVDASSPRADWDDLFEGAYRSDNAFMDQTYRRTSGEYPTFAKQSASPPVLCVKFDRFQDVLPRLLELYAADELKAVAIVRNPCAAIHSWLTAPREFPADADPLDQWRSGAVKKEFPGDFFGFDDWKAITAMQLDMAERHPDRLMVVQYERLVDAPLAVTGRVFDFLGLALEPQTTGFLADCHSRRMDTVYSVYRPPTVKDRWRAALQPEIRDAIHAELASGPLAQFLV